MRTNFTPWHSCFACGKPVDLTGTGHGPETCPHCGTWPLTLRSHYTVERENEAGELESEPS